MIRYLLLVGTISAVPAAAGSTNTTFTYQGELRAGGDAASGSFDMNFSLWDALADGAQIGSTIDKPGIVVAEGRFNVQLEMGANAFDNSSRWLEITVEGFTLSPRQPITRSPYSIQTRGIFVDEDKNVGIGTTSPQRELDIEASEPALRLTATDTGPTATPRLQLKSSDGPGVFRPLGAVEFLDEMDTVRAAIRVNKSGPLNARMTFSVVPGESPQLRITSGNIEFGQDRIRPAVAYGRVSAGGILLSGSSNVSSITWVRAGVYRIEIEGGILDTDVTLATLKHAGIVTAVGSGGQLDVSTFSEINGVSNDREFSFVVYRP